MDIEKLKKRCGYDGKPQQWQYGFDLACRELAKAQAVPEGFVVLAVDDVERICRCLDDHAIYITYKASDALENIQAAMIEAQEQK